MLGYGHAKDRYARKNAFASGLDYDDEISVAEHFGARAFCDGDPSRSSFLTEHTSVCVFTCGLLHRFRLSTAHLQPHLAHQSVTLLLSDH